MSYAETLEYLFTRLPMFSRIGPAAYKNDLNNTLLLCKELGDPQHQFKSIHVAGTNGKGSVSHMLASVLQAAGYKTGLYTSPHLKDFRERIRIDGRMIPEPVVVDFTDRVRPLIEHIEPSFFEITVAMAFEHFAREQVDIAVIEVGLGGRLDSTNVILPEVSVITNIGWDHMNLLGATLPAIAGEKAGIIKPGIPVVIGETLPETRSVFERRASDCNSVLHLAAETRTVLSSEWNDGYLVADVRDLRNDESITYQLDLPGIYQTHNLLTVLKALDVLREKGWTVPEQAVETGLREVRSRTGLHGRWEVLHRNPLLVLDVAHNRNGITELLEQVKRIPHRHLHLIIGMAKDKDTTDILRLLPTSATFYFTQAQIPRALPADALRTEGERLGYRGNSYTTVNTALYAASLNASSEDLILVCGSIFVVGEVSGQTVREIWKGEPDLSAFWDLLSAANHC
jgi:dihydrofolate synthase/folylpolyglutamate synthase